MCLFVCLFVEQFSFTFSANRQPTQCSKVYGVMAAGKGRG